MVSPFSNAPSNLIDALPSKVRRTKYELLPMSSEASRTFTHGLPSPDPVIASS